MLVRINASRQALCLLIATADRVTFEIFCDWIEPNVNLRVHLGGGASGDKTIFHVYPREDFIHKIQSDRVDYVLADAHAELMMNNCSAHGEQDMLQLFITNHMNLMSFPSHKSGIFQILDLVFFWTFKRAKRPIARNSVIAAVPDQALRMLRHFETAATSSIIKVLFQLAGCLQI
jgi:hypothetical protein